MYCRIGEDGPRGSEHDKANLMTATTSQCHKEGAQEDGLVEVGEKGRGGDKFFLLSVTNCKPVMFSLSCGACI